MRCSAGPVSRCTIPHNSWGDAPSTPRSPPKYPAEPAYGMHALAISRKVLRGATCRTQPACASGLNLAHELALP